MKDQDIDAVVIHCSATKEGVNMTRDDIKRWHVQGNGWLDIGYNYVIELDGKIMKGRPLTMSGAHTNTAGVSGKPYNSHSVGICYVGGLDKNGKPKDTRTIEQIDSMHILVKYLCDNYPIKEVIGHRDASPDLNGDGVVTSREWIKACPCFEVKREFNKYVHNK